MASLQILGPVPLQLVLVVAHSRGLVPSLSPSIRGVTNSLALLFLDPIHHFQQGRNPDCCDRHVPFI